VFAPLRSSKELHPAIASVMSTVVRMKPPSRKLLLDTPREAEMNDFGRAAALIAPGDVAVWPTSSTILNLPGVQVVVRQRRRRREQPDATSARCLRPPAARTRRVRATGRTERSDETWARQR